MFFCRSCRLESRRCGAGWRGGSTRCIPAGHRNPDDRRAWRSSDVRQGASGRRSRPSLRRKGGAGGAGVQHRASDCAATAAFGGVALLLAPGTLRCDGAGGPAHPRDRIRWRRRVAIGVVGTILRSALVRGAGVPATCWPRSGAAAGAALGVSARSHVPARGYAAGSVSGSPALLPASAREPDPVKALRVSSPMAAPPQRACGIDTEARWAGR